MSSKFASALRSFTRPHTRGWQTTRLMSRGADANSSSEDNMKKYDARQVAFSPTRLEDITHNYTERTNDVEDDIDIEDSEEVSAYKCGSNVNLYAHMQSNVPEPFDAENRSPSSLNMPGGGASRSEKYISGQRQSINERE
ncbi:uncharacterized protein LOC135390958 [Ornithodoros turicata]|uniref:uncharacterized protein LOC135390958 n=1 Tax=Ornithodoros turicata TaxID=34597 RepID=UPI003138850D